MAKTFEVIYQAAGAGSGKTVQVDIYKPSTSPGPFEKVDVQSGLAEEIGGTGRYYKSFQADEVGWFAEIADSNGGKAVKHFGPVEWATHGIIDLVGDVQTAVNAVASAISTLQDAVDAVGGKVDIIDDKVDSVDGKVTTVGTNVLALASAMLDIGSQLGAVSSKIDELESPPMVG